MAKIVKEADFNNIEDDHRVVRLSSSYGSWNFTELIAILHPSYQIRLSRVADGEVKHWDMGVKEMEALCKVWEQYKADLSAVKPYLVEQIEGEKAASSIEGSDVPY